jgi:phosphate transport system substrate-binding protein
MAMHRNALAPGFSAILIAAALAQARQTPAASSSPDLAPPTATAAVIRVYGSDLNGMMVAWERGFRRLHPGVRFQNRFPSSDGWAAGMEADDDDIGTSGREPVLTEYLSFAETFGYDPTEIPVATGAYDQEGKSWAIVIYVNEDNPLRELTMAQLDGVFGSERSGGYRRYRWMPQYGRGVDENLRTWGQVGLTGKWITRSIHTYGYADTGMRNFFELKVFHGGDKWNSNYKEYVESGTKMVSSGPVGRTGSSRYMLQELARDPAGIAWTGIPQAAGIPGLRPLPIAAEPGGPYVFPTRQTVRNRTYPLTRSIYMFLNRPPGRPLRRPVRQFMRYVLSRQGQSEVTRVGAYLPLPEAFARKQLGKLN